MLFKSQSKWKKSINIWTMLPVYDIMLKDGDLEDLSKVGKVGLNMCFM